MRVWKMLQMAESEAGGENEEALAEEEERLQDESESLEASEK